MTQPPMVPPSNAPVPHQSPVDGYPPQPYQQHPQHPQPPYPVQQQAGGYVQPNGGMAVAPKNPGLALLASFFIPGLGSMLNGNVLMGIIVFVCDVIAWISLTILIGFVLVPVVWIWGMIHAYHGAKRWNRKHGILS
jgi:TM2 domain-containing membrane protein YozV